MKTFIKEYAFYLSNLVWYANSYTILSEWLNSYHYAFPSFHFFSFDSTACGIFPDWRSNLCLLQWKFEVLTIGPAGNSLNTLFLTADLLVFLLCIQIPIYNLVSLWRTCFEQSPVLVSEILLGMTSWMYHSDVQLASEGLHPSFILPRTTLIQSFYTLCVLEA